MLFTAFHKVHNEMMDGWIVRIIFLIRIGRVIKENMFIRFSHIIPP